MIRNCLKVIQLSRSFIPWAIAALLIVSVGIWIYSVVSPTDGRTDCNTLACLERKEILNSGNLEDLENEELYQMVNPVSLEKNIKNHIIIGQDIRDTSDDSSNNDLLEDL